MLMKTASLEQYLINKRSLSPYPRDKDLESIQNSLRYHSR